MLWNLVTANYEKYHLHHLARIVALLIYSFLGAYIFIILEADNERSTSNEQTMRTLRRSLQAKNLLVNRIEEFLGSFVNSSTFSETQLRRILAEYDAEMDIKIDNRITPKWDIWGGLYYSGTIYTTIGYGDLAAVTIAGRIFTMIYAMIGIPMVISILNDWGNILFHYVDDFWKSYGIRLYTKFKRKLGNRKVKSVEEGTDNEQLIEEPKLGTGSDQENHPLPLFLVLLVLFLWAMICVGYFAIFENWTIFESIYFFFISMTTIGFGDITPTHSVAVGGIFIILGSLSVVSMSINVIQMKLEYLFNKIVQDIENDFKTSLSIAAEESRKKSIGVSEHGNIVPSKKKAMTMEGDVANKYTQGMDSTNKFLMKFMSNHQKKMLNDKFDERAKMRNSSTQTTSQIKVASVQTMERYEQQWDEEPEEEVQPKSRINTRRLYIYNTGE